MVFAFSLLTSLLLASVALSLPSPPQTEDFVDAVDTLKRQDHSPSEQPVTDYVASDWWAGAYISGASDTFEKVFGTVTVPTASDSINLWVGLDGLNCANVLFASGIYITVSSGKATYKPFYALDHTTYWYTQTLAIKAGDVLRFSVHATSTTTGIATVENLTTKQHVQQSVVSSQVPRPLCRNSADWILSDYDTSKGLASFSDVIFTDAHAYGPKGKYTPQGGNTLEIVLNNLRYTSTTVSGDKVTIKRI